jgi:fatty-acyl-CoA synthase
MIAFDDLTTATVATARRQTIADLLRRSAVRHPARTAIVDGETRVTYAELNTAVDRAANALAERGLAKGDRLALLGHNSLGFVITYFASARLGLICVPINYMLGADEVAYILDHAGATAMVAEDMLLPLAEAGIAAAGREQLVTVRGVIGDALACAGGRSPLGEAGWEPVSEWARHDDASEPVVALSDDDPVELLYTSGTESRPKGTILTSRSLVAQHVSCFVDGEMTPDDVEVHALPLFHSAQLHCFFTPSIHLGAVNVLLPKADPAAMLAAVEAERATKLFCPPTVWIALLNHPDFDRRDLSSLRKGYYGASVMPVEVLAELGERLPGVRLFNFYGQTEMSPVATVLGPDDQVRKAGSAGRPALNVETIVVDDDGDPVPAGEVGEIVHRSPQAMLGYWDDPEKTAETFRGGWLHTGDLGILDDEGYLYVVDRKKDMIKSGGENVASREVEEVIHAHPAVAEAAVFAIPHPRWIEAVAAAVVPRAGHELAPAEVTAFCRERLAGFKTPRYVVIADRLPKNPSGKILKRELRTTHAGLAAQKEQTR